VTTAGAAGIPDLRADDKSRVERGETVVRERAVNGWPWPEMIAYRKSTAPPIAIAAVYADWDAQASYMPGMVASRVVGRDAPNVARVFFEYEVPGPNERYTVVATITREGNEWVVRWTLVRARYARRLEGMLRVIPHGEGSLLIDSNLVDPGTLASNLGTPATVATQLRQAVEALTARTEKLATTEPARLTALVDALTSAVPKEAPAR
jgi:hypothetical protein